MSDDPCFLTVAEAGRRIATGDQAPVALTDAYLDRIERLDPQLDSYITITADLARRQAKAAAAEIVATGPRGPLHGIPFGLKDMFETAGILTTAHSAVLKDHVPATDAHAVARLYAAGAVLLGKQATHEFAHGGPSFDLPWPPARNPWSTAHYPGGSSSGSAASVAGRLAAAALGTDTGGSIRDPAALCGVVGLKPTYGLIGRGGVVPFSATCDHVGPITRTVEDSALLLQAIAGPDPRDPDSISTGPLPDYAAALTGDIRGMRIGVIRHFYEEDVPASPLLVKAVDAAIDVLRDLGAIVEDIRLKPLQHYYAIRITITESELFARHQAVLQRDAGLYGANFLSRILAATLFSSVDYLAARLAYDEVAAEMAPLYGRFDALLTAASGPAARLATHRSIGAEGKWTRPPPGTLFSLTRGPAVALPCGFSPDGLPLGLQIAGRPLDDAKVLRIAHAYERATLWCDRLPPLRDGVAPVAIEAETPSFAATDLDPVMRRHVEARIAHAGLTLSDAHMALLCGAAPHAFAMIQRLKRSADWVRPSA